MIYNHKISVTSKTINISLDLYAICQDASFPVYLQLYDTISQDLLVIQNQRDSGYLGFFSLRVLQLQVWQAMLCEASESLS